MPADVLLGGVVVGSGLPGAVLPNLSAQLPKLSEIAHFLCDQNLALF